MLRPQVASTQAAAAACPPPATRQPQGIRWRMGATTMQRLTAICQRPRRTRSPLEFSVFISSAYAQAAAGAADTQSQLMGMLPLVLMFVVLYFVMIRPQMKKAKEHKAMVEALAKGDEVILGGGMLGKISKLGETYLSVEVASGVEVQMQRAAVIQVLPKGTIK